MAVFLVEDVSDSGSELLSVDEDNSLSESACLEDLLHEVNLALRLTLVLELLNVTQL